MSRTSSARQFWAIADRFRQAGPPWMPTNVGYELKRIVEAAGKPWTVCLKVHVVSDDKAVAKGSGRLRFKSSVTLWPPDLTKGEQRGLAKLGWYKASARELAKMGYDGKWSPSPYGMWGDFWKDLTSVAGVLREARRLERLQLNKLPGLPGSDPDR